LIRLSLAVSVILFIVGMSSAFAGDDDSAAVVKSDSVRQQYEQTRRDIDDLLSSQADIYDQLDKVERNLEESSRKQRWYRREIKRLDSDITGVKKDIGETERSRSFENSLYNQHVLALYMHSSTSQQPSGTVSPASFWGPSHKYLLQRLLQSDQEYLQTLYLQIDGYRELLGELTQKQEELESLHAAQRAEQQKYQKTLRRRERLLATTQSQQRSKVEQLASIEETSSLMGEIIAQSETGIADSVVSRERELVMRMKGRLFWPVHGRVITPFGLRRDSVTNLRSKCSGVMLASQPGTKVIAALTGEVIYIGWARGLENFVVVSNGGKIYSLYGNLDRIRVKEGDQVIRGESFAVAAGDQLHFEIREGKKAVNPLSWLK
jgi:septal ring factor EnvC (AmiA/AmiB activator)